MDQKEKEIRDKKVLKIFLLISIGLSFILEIAYIIFHNITGKANVFLWLPLCGFLQLQQ